MTPKKPTTPATKAAAAKEAPASSTPDAVVPKGPRAGQLVAHRHLDLDGTTEVTRYGLVVATGDDGATVAWLPAGEAVLPADQLEAL